MASDVCLCCTDCRQRRVLDAAEGDYLSSVRSFIAAHQLCRPRAVVVEVRLPQDAPRRVSL
jgi:hypothetical protein